jgi:hypothetical protein
MKRSWSVVLLLLSGCSSSDVPQYLNNRIVRDSDGCAFVVRHNVGDTLFLSHVRELSAATCQFEKRK